MQYKNVQFSERAGIHQRWFNTKKRVAVKDHPIWHGFFDDE
jgi:hypothetical protein